MKSLKFGTVSLYIRAVVLALFCFIFITECQGEVWDFHIHTEADDRQAERDKEQISRDRYDSICEKEERGQSLSDRESRERDNWEYRNLN